MSGVNLSTYYLILDFDVAFGRLRINFCLGLIPKHPKKPFYIGWRLSRRVRRPDSPVHENPYEILDARYYPMNK
jgi:hypothetical protein